MRRLLRLFGLFREGLPAPQVYVRQHLSDAPITSLSIKLSGENLRIRRDLVNHQLSMTVRDPISPEPSMIPPYFEVGDRLGEVLLRSSEGLSGLLPLLVGAASYEIELTIPPELQEIRIESARSEIVIETSFNEGHFNMMGGTLDLQQGCPGECKVEIFGTADITIRRLFRETLLSIQSVAIGSRLFLPRSALAEDVGSTREKYLANTAGAQIKFQNLMGIEVLTVPDAALPAAAPMGGLG